jgi:hypothetical protein
MSILVVTAIVYRYVRTGSLRTATRYNIVGTCTGMWMDPVYGSTAAGTLYRYKTVDSSTHPSTLIIDHHGMAVESCEDLQSVDHVRIYSF